MRSEPTTNSRHRTAAAILRALAVCLLIAVSACERSTSTAPTNPPSAPTATTPAPPAVPVAEIQRKITMEIGGQSFTLEVAATDADRQRGLMYREKMAADHGMIFVFPDEATRGFWMRNTLIPLDILYIDSFGKIVRVAQMKPLDETSVPSGWPAKYAIELNAGTTQRLGVTAGTVLRIPPEARDTRE